MMFRKITIPLFLLLFTFPAHTQSNDPAAENARLLDLCKKLDGTYQLQIVNSREAGEIPLQYMDTIVAKREMMDTVYFYYPDKPELRLMILPQSVIQNNDYPKPQRIIHVIK